MLFAVSTMAAPLGTEFTYQGVLADGGVPASGAFDFRFLLYDADVGGAQVGAIVYVEDVTVTDGRMTTQLDFGSVFDGTALWLEVGVRDGGSTGAYTVLSPRQELTAAPFAQHAQSADAAVTSMTAGHATTAGDADTLDGQHGSFYLTWSNFIGIPGDLADGDDDTLGDLSCGAGDITRWNGTAWYCGSDDDTPYIRTYVVGPVGTTSQNGTALRNAIAAITPPISQEEAVLLKVEPGVYDIGTAGIEIWGWMTLEGAGEDSTRITGTVCGPDIHSAILTSTSDHVVLGKLTAENTCSDAAYSVVLDSQGDYASAHDAAFIAETEAGFNVALNNTGSHLKLRGVTLRGANATGENRGLINSGSSADLVDVVVSTVGGGIAAWGIENSSSGFSLRGSNVVVSSSADSCIGLRHATGNGQDLRNVTISVSGTCSSESVGIHFGSASGRVQDVNVTGDVAIRAESSISSESITLWNVEARGVDEGVSCDAGVDPVYLWVFDSWVSGLNGYGVVNVPGSQDCSVHVNGSYVAGSTGGVSGIASCVATRDSSTFLPTGCP